VSRNGGQNEGTEVIGFCDPSGSPPESIHLWLEGEDRINQVTANKAHHIAVAQQPAVC
jgi:hypothetical protein